MKQTMIGILAGAAQAVPATYATLDAGGKLSSFDKHPPDGADYRLAANLACGGGA
ncbi:MAG: hypothetical protein K0R43_170 [Pseudoduganella sp.]|jgi:hypothetical protein|nr:hypothetical protein [Pseudoduganella sp.]